MHRCHYCGKIHRELLYKCHRCGYRFCSDHHLPENHNCSDYHTYENHPRKNYCKCCGREISGQPLRCTKCGLIFCGFCGLPENHGCATTPRYNPDPARPSNFHKEIARKFRIGQTAHHIWSKTKENITLKNFTILSTLLVFVGFLSLIFPSNNYETLLKFIFNIGIFCLILAYFFYALKCWGAGSKLCAVFMTGVPPFIYYLATSKISDSTTNVLLYIAIVFCFYTIISAILLYVSDLVKTGIERHIFKKSWRSRHYFYPELSYSLFGVVVVSFIALNFGSALIFSENATTVSQTLQKMPIPGYSSPNSRASSSVANYQNNQIIPTPQPDVVNNIVSTVANSPPSIDIPTLEGQIHQLINQERRKNGISSLSYDSSLSSIARKHSADMALNNYFSHYNLQGLDPSGRGSRDGYSCYKNYGSYYTHGIAENIMQNNLYDSVTYYDGIPRYAWNSQEEIAQSTVSGWMNSPGHRQNILTPTYDREGLGVAIASDNKVYITEDFC